MKSKNPCGWGDWYCSAASVWLVKCSKGSKYLLVFFFTSSISDVILNVLRGRTCDRGQISPSRSASLSLISFHLNFPKHSRFQPEAASLRVNPQSKMDARLFRTRDHSDCARARAFPGWTSPLFFFLVNVLTGGLVGSCSGTQTCSCCKHKHS